MVVGTFFDFFSEILDNTKCLTVQVQKPADEGQKGDLGSGGGDKRAPDSAASGQILAQVRPDQETEDVQEGLGLHDQVQHEEAELKVF